MQRRHPRKFAMPADARRFAPVVQAIREQGRVAGFELARDVLLDQYEQLDEIPAAVRLKLAIEFDRHALFSEAFGQKSKAGAGDWQGLQEWLNQPVAELPQTTATITRGGGLRLESAPSVDADDGLNGDGGDDAEDDD